MGWFAATGCVLAPENRAAGDIYLLLQMHLRCSQCACAVDAVEVVCSLSVLIGGVQHKKNYLEVCKRKLSLWKVPHKTKISRRMKTSRTTDLCAGQNKILKRVSFSDVAWFTLSSNVHSLMTRVNVNTSPQAVHEIPFSWHYGKVREFTTISGKYSYSCIELITTSLFRKLIEEGKL